MPEPLCDIRAQIEALCDPGHPKDAVFIDNSTAFVVCRDEGTLITTDLRLAEFFRTKTPLTDDDIGLILGYPEKKAAVIAAGDGVVVQAKNKDGYVVTEAVASKANVTRTIEAFAGYGEVGVFPPAEVIKRRMENR